MPSVRVEPKQLQDRLLRMFTNHGVASAEAEEIAAHLVESNLMGHDSHGAVRGPWYVEKIQKKEIVLGAPIEIEKEGPAFAMVNGNWGFGQPVARFAMELAIRKAQANALACVTVRQCNHVGRLGAYTALASKQGMIGIGMANLHGTSHCVAPFGGREPKLPTNPISIAFPSGREPDFLLDMTTSIVAEGKVKMKLNRGEKLPDGWVIDAEGKPAERPSQFYGPPRGALLPLGGAMGYKGFALSLAVDAISGALSGAECSNPQSRRHGNACVFMAINIRHFVPQEEFEAKVNGLIQHVKSAKVSVGSAGIYMPGEPEQAAGRKSRKEGIFIEQPLWDQISELAGMTASLP